MKIVSIVWYSSSEMRRSRSIDRATDMAVWYLVSLQTVYFFCGKRCDRLKALYWEIDGLVLLYKRLERGNFQWPRSESEARSLTLQ